MVEPNVSLCNWCALLGTVYVGHNTSTGAYPACANSVSIARGVKVGSAAFSGAGVTIREYLRIGPHALVDIGAVVIRDVPEGSIAVGNPSSAIGRTAEAKSLRENAVDVGICDRPVLPPRKPSGTIRETMVVITPEEVSDTVALRAVQD